MIEIDQALVNSFIEGDFGLAIAHENVAFEPSKGTPYAELAVFQNDFTPASVAHSDETDGVFRVTLRYPVGKTSGPAKAKANEITDWFCIGSRHVYEGQRVTITSVRRDPGVPEDGWFKLILSINYKAFTKRVAA